MKKVVILSIALSLGWATNGKPSIDTAAVLLKVTSQLKGVRSVWYQYVMSAIFPNGDKDKMTGRLFARSEDRLLLNDCDAYTLLYTRKWLYTANHRKKTITITDLGTKANSALRASTEKRLFQNDMLTAFLDSAVVKLSQIRSYKRIGDTVTDILLAFGPGLLPRSLHVVMNDRSSIPDQYTLVVSQPDASGKKSTTTTMQCSGFTNMINKKDLDVAAYFDWQKGKIILKKYATYTINVEQ